VYLAGSQQGAWRQVGTIWSGLDNFALNLSGLLSALLTVPPTLSHPWARVGWLWCANGGAGKFGPQTHHLWL